MSQREHIDSDELLKLEQKYEAILANEPESSAFCLLADIQYKLGKVDQATGVLIRGLKVNKNNVTARSLLGKIYYDRWLIDQAKKEMEKVLELAPDKLDTAKLLSEIYKSEDNYKRAFEILEAVSVFQSDNVELVQDLNDLKEELSKKQSEASRHVFETPLESRKISKLKIDDSTLNEAVYTEVMLNLYIDQGEFDKAREAIEHMYQNQEQKRTAIENLEKTKLNRVNMSAGF